MTVSRTRSTKALTVALLTSAVFLTHASAQPASAAKPKAVLVELFTSEGCSSCPPADALLREVNGMRTAGDQLIVGISEHVTYWNQLGWSDPYSSESFTNRQVAYRDRFRLDSVYTPQMVINGSEEFVGSDRNKLRRAIDHQLEQKDTVAIHILNANVAGGKLTLSLSTLADPSIKAPEIFLVIADDVDETSVSRGENSGRKLTHVAVARSIARVTSLQGDSAQPITLPLPPSYRAAQPHHVIVFAQAPGTGRILGIDTKPL